MISIGINRFGIIVITVIAFGWHTLHRQLKYFESMVAEVATQTALHLMIYLILMRLLSLSNDMKWRKIAQVWTPKSMFSSIDSFWSAQSAGNIGRLNVALSPTACSMNGQLTRKQLIYREK